MGAMKSWIVLLVALLLGSGERVGAAAARLLEGRVTHVGDGDSLWLAPAAAGAPVELRLVGIDAPEICQAWGPEARRALADWVLGRQVSVETVGRDVHGRTLGTVYLDGRNINLLLVQEGHAWSARFKYDRGPYVAAERMARALGRGLNQGGAALEPREFRRQHGPCWGAPAQAPHTASAAASAAAPAPASASRHCDGRLHCSQMNSCDEAVWFLRNCPGVRMDGNRDGVPCERQWCRP